jgi:hypothetical protein
MRKDISGLIPDSTTSKGTQGNTSLLKIILFQTNNEIKCYIFSISYFNLAFTQNMDNKTIEQRLAAIEQDGTKFVVDEFQLMDTKEIDKQVLLLLRMASGIHHWYNHRPH